MSKEELIRDYLKNIEQLITERLEKCQGKEREEKLKIFDDYEKDIQAYKDAVVNIACA